MQSQRSIVLMIVTALFVVVGSGCCPPCPPCPPCPDPSADDFAVVVVAPTMGDPSDCAVYPPIFEAAPGVEWLLVANQGLNPVRVQISGDVADISGPNLIVDLDVEESTLIKLRTDVHGTFPLTIDGHPTGCPSGLPNPQIVIP